TPEERGGRRTSDVGRRTPKALGMRCGSTALLRCGLILFRADRPEEREAQQTTPPLHWPNRLLRVWRQTSDVRRPTPCIITLTRDDPCYLCSESGPVTSSSGSGSICSGSITIISSLSAR